MESVTVEFVGTLHVRFPLFTFSPFEYETLPLPDALTVKAHVACGT